MICQSERLQSVDTGSPITAQQDGGTKPTNSLGMKFGFADEGDSASFFKKSGQRTECPPCKWLSGGSHLV